MSVWGDTVELIWNTPTPVLSCRYRMSLLKLQAYFSAKLFTEKKTWISQNQFTVYIIPVSLPEMATLYVSPHPDDFRSLLALIAAEFCPSSRPRTLTEDPPASLNSRSRPTLVLDAGKGDSVLSGANAVSWYLALQGKSAGVDTKQQSQVWQWLSFADNELIPVSCAVVFPLMGVLGLDKKVRGVSK